MKMRKENVWVLFIFCYSYKLKEIDCCFSYHLWGGNERNLEILAFVMKWIFLKTWLLIKPCRKVYFFSKKVLKCAVLALKNEWDKKNNLNCDIIDLRFGKVKKKKKVSLVKTQQECCRHNCFIYPLTGIGDLKENWACFLWGSLMWNVKRMWSYLDCTNRFWQVSENT